MISRLRITLIQITSGEGFSMKRGSAISSCLVFVLFCQVSTTSLALNLPDGYIEIDTNNYNGNWKGYAQTLRGPCKGPFLEVSVNGSKIQGDLLFGNGAKLKILGAIYKNNSIVFVLNPESGQQGRRSVARGKFAENEMVLKDTAANLKCDFEYKLRRVIND